MTVSGLEAILRDIRGASIGVIGDFCLDAYWDLDASLSEISIETGLATRAVRRQRYSLGGAGNVANNLAAMGVGRVSAFGVLGDDPFGREMARILEAGGIEGRGIIIQPEHWTTPVYIKPFETGKEQGRIDFGGANQLDRSGARDLLVALEKELSRLDLVIINQQLTRGIHTEELRTGLCSLMRQSSTPFIVDSRAFSQSFDGAIRKLNDREALRLCEMPWKQDAPVPREQVAQAAQVLFGRFRKPVFITRGARGILGRESAGTFEVPGLRTVGRIDTVGAGDSALAGLAAALACGYGCAEAAVLGNLAAGVSVRKLYTTGTASPAEILELGTDPDYDYRPEIAEDPGSARFHEDTEIEIVTGLRHGRPVRHAVFDFDGTVSTLREGWEEIMARVMVRAVLGTEPEGASAEVSTAIAERVRDYIDSTTGLQTIAQMHGLVEMVGQFGFVPEGAVHDAGEHKAEYDEELEAMVRARTARLRSGEFTADDFMVKGVRLLLEALHRAGVRLFLASGSDHEKVMQEVEALGVAELFDGGVMGSLGDPRIEAKKEVLSRIEAQAGPDALADLVVFGDGPFEVRETKRRGGYAVGVAVDEPRRFGWDMKKRSRLVRAGADIIVPDFLQWERLLRVLGVRS